MNYQEFLAMCREASIRTFGFSQLDARFRNKELVTHKWNRYIPVKVHVWYDKYGEQKISAEIAEIGKNAHYVVDMDEVKKNE